MNSQQKKTYKHLQDIKEANVRRSEKLDRREQELGLREAPILRREQLVAEREARCDERERRFAFVLSPIIDELKSLVPEVSILPTSNPLLPGRPGGDSLEDFSNQIFAGKAKVQPEPVDERVVSVEVAEEPTAEIVRLTFAIEEANPAPEEKPQA